MQQVLIEWGDLSVAGRGAGDDRGGVLLREIDTLVSSDNFLLERNYF